MSKIKNDGLDQYDAGPFEHQQFGAAGVEGVNPTFAATRNKPLFIIYYLFIFIFYLFLFISFICRPCWDSTVSRLRR